MIEQKDIKTSDITLLRQKINTYRTFKYSYTTNSHLCEYIALLNHNCFFEGVGNGKKLNALGKEFIKEFKELENRKEELKTKLSSLKVDTDLDKFYINGSNIILNKSFNQICKQPNFYHFKPSNDLKKSLKDFIEEHYQNSIKQLEALELPEDISQIEKPNFISGYSKTIVNRIYLDINKYNKLKSQIDNLIDDNEAFRTKITKLKRKYNSDKKKKMKSAQI